MFACHADGIFPQQKRIGHDKKKRWKNVNVSSADYTEILNANLIPFRVMVEAVSVAYSFRSIEESKLMQPANMLHTTSFDTINT